MGDEMRSSLLVVAVALGTVASSAGAKRPVVLSDASVKTEANKFGGSVFTAGDVNGDGWSDVIVGAEGAGAAYLYLGSSAGPSLVWYYQVTTYNAYCPAEGPL